MQKRWDILSSALFVRQLSRILLWVELPSNKRQTETSNLLIDYYLILSCCIKAVTYIKLTIGKCRPSLSAIGGLVFALRSTALALVWPLWAAFWPFEHVDSAMEHSGETDHSDWLFSLVNQCTRRKIKVTKASNRYCVFYGLYHSHSHRCSFSGYSFEWRIQHTTITCRHGELFPIMHADCWLYTSQCVQLFDADAGDMRWHYS